MKGRYYMNLVTNKTAFCPQFTGFIPAKQYKGPVLKLTQDDLAEISKLKEQIALFECDLYNLCKYHSYKRQTSKEIDAFTKKQEKITFQIEKLKEEIRNIKKQRFAIQKGNK